MITFVMRHVKEIGKMNLVNAVNWYRGGRNMECVVFVCVRHSERGKVEPIYVLSAGSMIGQNQNRVPYIIDTGKGHGGKGTLEIKAILSVADLSGVAGAYNNDKRPVYIMV